MEGKFEVLNKIGEGGQGSVFLVKDKDSGKLYARKLVSCDDIDELNRNLKEVQAMLKLSHPYIVRTESFYIKTSKVFNIEKFMIYILMEYCDFKTLEEYIQKTRKIKEIIPLSIVFGWIREITLSICYVHSKNLIHRDLKPANIFLSHDDNKILHTKLGDFGFVKFMRNKEKYTHTILGSRNYLSPEMKKEEKYTSKVDIWGITTILLSLLLEKDFDFAYQLLEDKNVFYDRMKGRYPKESKELCAFVEKIFRLSPDDRPSGPLLLSEIEKVIKELKLENGKNCKMKGKIEKEFIYGSIGEKNEFKMEEIIGKDLGNSHVNHDIVKKLLDEKEEEIYFLKDNLKRISRKYFELKKHVVVKKSKENYSMKELMSLKSHIKPIIGRRFEITLMKLKKKGSIVALKKCRKKINTIDEFKALTSFEKIKNMENDMLEKVLGVCVHKKQFYLVTEGFVTEKLREYLRNFNHKLNIFSKIKLCFDIAYALCHLHKWNFYVPNFNISKIFIYDLINANNIKKKTCKVIGVFEKTRDEKKKASNITAFFEIMCQIFTRFSDQIDIKKYKVKNEFEEEYLNIMNSEKVGKNVTAKNLVYEFDKLLEKQWLHIQNLAKKKKSENSDSSGRLVLKNLKENDQHKLKLEVNDKDLSVTKVLSDK